MTIFSVTHSLVLRTWVTPGLSTSLTSSPSVFLSLLRAMVFLLGTYEGSHMIWYFLFFFFLLPLFISHDPVLCHSCKGKYQVFILPDGWKIICWQYGSHFLYPRIFAMSLWLNPQLCWSGNCRPSIRAVPFPMIKGTLSTWLFPLPQQVELTNNDKKCSPRL